MSIEPTRFLATVAALLLLGGCSRTVKPCPVSGTVSVNGQPAGGVYVLFHVIDDPQKKQAPDATRTRADGSFSARVHGPGEYAVTVFWPSVNIEDGEAIEGEDHFAGKHRAPENPVLKATIQPGENVLAPIHLTYP
jgi:hypothetical protein